MHIPFRNARIKPIVVGALKYSGFLTRHLPVAAGATGNARYCYAVWMRHFVGLLGYNKGKIPGEVLELGPGDSLGAGIAALLSGAEQYWALEVIKYWDVPRNLRILDELVVLFRNKTPIPDNNEFPLLRPSLEDYRFPSEILTDRILEESLRKDRLDQIRHEISVPDDPGNHFIKFRVPWYQTDIIRPESADFIFSQAVLQHIDYINHAFVAMHTWLAPQGFMSHVTDYSSLGFTRYWNGHWTMTDLEWKIMKGGRKFLTNRLTHSAYVKLHKEFKLRILEVKTVTKPNEIPENQLVKNFRNLPEEDLTTFCSWIISVKE
ncbi:MAG: hypothetical protein JNL22_09655 [Bacteroidales bacterium]|nr:hypothetical protein [Bacteroidales bacterium]